MKALVNSGFAISGVALGAVEAGVGASVGAALVMGYGAIQAGKNIAEYKEGESFSDSQQRYLDGIRSINSDLIRFDHNQISKYATGTSE